MAFSQEEQNLIKWGQQNGKTAQEIKQAVTKLRLGVAPTPQPKVNEKKDNFITETAGDLKDTFLGVGEELNKAGENIVDIRNSEMGAFDQILGIGSEFFKGGSRAFGEGVTGAGKIVLPQETEEAVSEGVGKVASNIAESGIAQNITKKYQSLSPDQKKRVDDILGFSEGLLDIATLGGASKVIKPVVRESTRIAKETAQKGGGVFSEGVDTLTSRFTKTPQTVDEVIEQADTVLKQTDTGKIRQGAEETAVKTNLKEKFTGLTPDVKKRLQEAGPEKLQEYLDVVHARNVDDTVPTPYEYGASKVDNAVQEMSNLLNETGSQIGGTRQKLATIKAPVDAVQRMEQSILKELDKLNLEVVNGQVVQKAGTVSRLGTGGDLKLLNELLNQFKIVKQSPTLTNIIDYRMLVDSQANFAKSAREVSGNIDPFAKSVRSTIAEEAGKVVGKESAGDLARYSDFIEAFTELQSYTNRRAGGEYLLRVVLSGRGGEARRLIQTIKDETGIDLMNDATLMVLVTDMLGNEGTKTLFKQQITQAGIDTARILKGDIGGATGVISRFLQDKFLDEEKILKEATNPSKR